MADQKNYILSIQATLKGDKVVLSGLKQIEGQTQKFTQTVNLAKKGTQDFGDILAKAGMRALLVAPIWLAIRSAMMLVLRTTQEIITTNLKFEDSMAEVQGMLSGTTQEINAQMSAIKRTILDTATNSRVKLNDLADAFRYLKSANLDFQQTMAGFPVVASLMNAFGLSAKEASRAFAGMLNTGKNFGDVTTIQEKASKIGDVLAYTYVKQDVLVSELVESYAKFAPFITLTNDSFLDVVTTLGFLNTQMLRGGQAGRLTGQAMLDLVKKSENLASVLGVTFDADKPLMFIERITAIKKAMGDMAQASGTQAKAITEIFSTRSGRSILLLLNNFEKWQDALKDAGDNYEGFLKKLEDLRMMTVNAQMARMTNLLAVLSNDFISGVYGVGDFAEALKAINDTLIVLRPNISGLGIGIGYLGEQLGVFLATIDAMARFDKTMINQLGKQVRGFGAYVDAQIKATAIAEQRQKQQKEQTESDNKLQEVKLNVLKEQKELISHQVTLLKTMGASEIDVAKYRLESLEVIRMYLTEEDYALEKQKAINTLVQAELKYREELVNTFQKASVDLLKTMGATEGQILTVRMKILEANRQAIGETAYMVQLEDLRLQRVIAIEAERQKELQTQTNLAQQYQKADENERGRLRRMMELRRLKPEELARQWEENMFDRAIIDQYFSNFSQKGQEAVGSVIQKMFDLPDMPITESPDRIPSLFEKVFSPDTVGIFWNTWTQQQEQALNRFGERWGAFANDFKGVDKFAERMTQQAIQQSVDLGTRIEKIEINLPADALKTVADEASRQLKAELETNPELQKKLAKLLRPHI